MACPGGAGFGSCRDGRDDELCADCTLEARIHELEAQRDRLAVMLERIVSWMDVWGLERTHPAVKVVLYPARDALGRGKEQA